MLVNNPLNFNILSLVVWFPALGALFIMLFMKNTQGNAIKWAANIITFVGFLISLPLWFYFDNNGPQIAHFRIDSQSILHVRFKNVPQKNDFFQLSAICSNAVQKTLG